MKEIWKPIKGFKNQYFVSNLGRVKSFNRKTRILKPFKNTKGYLYVSLPKKRCSIHRLVAKEFLPNPENLKEINHKDFNRKNNSLENLEWVSHKSNIRHSMKQGNMSSKRKNNTSGYLNIKFIDQVDKFRVSFSYDKKKYNIGYFSELSEAIKARDSAKKKIYEGVIQ